MITTQKMEKMISSFAKLEFVKKQETMVNMLEWFAGSDSILWDMQKIIWLDNCPESFLDFAYKFLVEKVYKLDQEKIAEKEKDYEDKMGKIKQQMEQEAKERDEADELLQDL